MLLNTKEYSKAYTLMKCIIFFIIFFFIQDINAQCQVDGGNDVFLCVDKFGEVTNKPMLNANVITGKPPFEINSTLSYSKVKHFSC